MSTCPSINSYGIDLMFMGRLVDANKTTEYFEYLTSNAKSNRPDIKNYTSTGVFGNFGSFNVEKRDRVRCMSGLNSLPMSRQWQKTPYFYPIQVAQFGLQHYSRFLTDPPPQIRKIEANSLNSHSTKHPISDTIYLEETSDFAIINLLPKLKFPVIKFQWMPLAPTSLFIFIVQDVETEQIYTINYQFSNKTDCVWPSPSSNDHSKNLDYFYSLGTFSSKNEYTTIIRDLNVDVIKAITSSMPPQKKDPLNLTNQIDQNKFKILSLTFRGAATIKLPIYQQTNAHKDAFLASANWLCETQNSKERIGGWSVSVDRELSGIKNKLKAGWVSAMGQGHGISVLVRAYNLTNDQKYFDTAARALRLFEVEAIDGGVRNHFLGLPWYEEYPTQPPSLVLNGFIYSLIGLYDMSTLSGEAGLKAKQLFEAGLDSLNVLLPFYDTGRGSSYDLKHATVKSIPNLARPDYHKAHVYLLKWLYVITGNELYQKFSNRWYNYQLGAHAQING
ncbi:Heparosan-N-sulfate-glucuronate 5-epimerase [Aphelenchoides bicaudatus]|nr:Heparosan-N-sulfate-glucuronate 5-epimerase [Aphelenchoides bicaudatus]